MRRRLPSETVEFALGAVEDASGTSHIHKLAVSLARDPDTGAVVEVVFVSRGKIGHGLDLLLHDLGVKLSRAIQGRDPETGGSEGD